MIRYKENVHTKNRALDNQCIYKRVDAPDV